VRSDLPTGTVTFLFSDVEGSTRLLHELGAKRYAEVLAEHRRVVRDACVANGGVEVDTQGDAFFLAFPTAPGALAAAQAITQELAPGPIRLRIGLHTGTPLLAEEGYVGPDVHRAARIAAVGHGGQVLVSASTAALLEAELRDLGEHRLKDLSAPERIYQLGESDFPPLASLRRTNLPVPATPFLGRKAELREVAEMLRREDVRLLTLTGPGGTGKTRLAVHAAAEVAERFPDGITWIPLAPLRDPSGVLATTAQALGVKERSGERLSEALQEALDCKRTLLLLDNAEHLLPDAASDFSLLAVANGPVVLVTSRERLRLQGEHLYPVPTLAEPDGRALFRARARALDPSFEGNGVVGQLCARLDNLPLAIELAAARSTLFSPEQLLERVAGHLDLLVGGRDADPRQRTLRATIEWSYDLLDSEEQRLFRSLSAFPGGCTYEAAEEVCGAQPDTLQSLLDKSLLRRRDSESGPRYWMLETIREFAAERLHDAAEDTQVRGRQAEWCCVQAERLSGMPPQRHLSDGFGSLPDEYDNIRSALAWAWESRRDDLGVRFGPACVRYWLSRSLFSDASDWLQRARPTLSSASSGAQLDALRAAGVIAFWILADTELAEEQWKRALPLAEELGDRDVIDWVERMLAGVAWERGDLEAALPLRERSLAKARASGDRTRQAEDLHWLGEVLRDLGRFEEADAHLLEADALYRDLSLWTGVANNLHSLADLALDRGDFAKAAALYQETIDLERKHGGSQGSRGLAYCLAGLASALAERGRTEDAAKLWGAVCAAEDALGFRMLSFERRRYEQRLAQLETTPSWREGNALTLEEAHAAIGHLA